MPGVLLITRAFFITEYFGLKSDLNNCYYNVYVSILVINKSNKTIMTEQELEKTKHPIVLFVKPDKITQDIIKDYISSISALPVKLRKATGHLTDEQLDTSYRPGGWTIRQLVHHLADAHINGFIRFKLALTEENPTVKPYDENEWAKLNDTNTMPIEPGLQIITGLHKRWTVLLNSMSGEEFKKTYYHPEQGKKLSLDEVLGEYAWHSDHHLAQITELKKCKKWD